MKHQHSRVNQAYRDWYSTRTELSLNELYRAVKEQTSKVLWGLLHEYHPELIADATSSVISKVHTFRGNSAFSTWVHRVAYNEGLMYLRRRRDDLTDPKDFDEITGPNSAKDVEATRLVEQIKELLSPREVLLLTLFEDGMSTRHAATQLGLSEQYVGRKWLELKEKIRRLCGSAVKQV